MDTNIDVKRKRTFLENLPQRLINRGLIKEWDKISHEQESFTFMRAHEQCKAGVKL